MFGRKTVRDLCHELALYVSASFYPDPLYSIVVSFFIRKHVVTEARLKEELKISNKNAAEVLKKLEVDGFISNLRSRRGRPQQVARGYILDFHRLIDYTNYRLKIAIQHIRQGSYQVKQVGYSCNNQGCKRVVTEDDLPQLYDEDQDQFFCLCGGVLQTTKGEAPSGDDSGNIFSQFRNECKPIYDILNYLVGKEIPDNLPDEISITADSLPMTSDSKMDAEAASVSLAKEPASISLGPGIVGSDGFRIFLFIIMSCCLVQEPTHKQFLLKFDTCVPVAATSLSSDFIGLSFAEAPLDESDEKELEASEFDDMDSEEEGKPNLHQEILVRVKGSMIPLSEAEARIDDMSENEYDEYAQILENLRN
eukprot:TRINITY_DN1235_c0_g1_i4.p1 TRINITY_DN1235_c0_g1~~TRINITY_DN1235_c0_g1_i4.p1  ORF type:complete len:365 (+),score=82.77 TRINITY_DN1235_c0_g1_i4:49-1143(+)